MIRIAAAGDVHYDTSSKGRLSRYFKEMATKADLFLIAGDLSQTGHPDEISVLAEDLKNCPVPVVTVLGNHDYHLDRVAEICDILKQAGVKVLERESTVLQIRGCSVGIAGAKGFGGGFVGACGSEFGEPEMKEFIAHSRMLAKDFEECLSALDADFKIALLHYSPTAQTLSGEKKEIYPFLGSYFLAEAVDRGGAEIAFHGHAHGGIEKGVTPGGVPVRNVALPVIRHAFNIYTLEKGEHRALSEAV